jgi:ATP-binding cassette subfamily F protein 3
VLDEIYDGYADKKITEIRGTLGAFLFSGDDVYKKVGVLSGGEKTRVSLVKLVLSRANLLMLDEPTNHLDIDTRERFEQALSDYGGVIIAVSHDRYFIRKFASRIFYFDEGQIKDYSGGYDDFLRFIGKSRQNSALSAENGAVTGTAGDATVAGYAEDESVQTISENRRNWLYVREERSKKRKQETRIAKLEDGICAIEKKLSAIETEMLMDDVISDHIRLTELSEEQHRLNLKLDALLCEWETEHEEY